MNRYDAMKARHQKAVDALPIGAAFSHEQFIETMQKWDLCHGTDGIPTEEDLKQIYHIGAGCFIRKKDYANMLEVFNRQENELDSAISEDLTGDGFIYEMFFSELCNHEYGYTGDDEDTLDALGYEWVDIETDERLKHGLEKAKREIEAWDI